MTESDGDTTQPIDFAFVKDRYDFELARKEQLTAALGLPVGILGLLGSLLAVIVRSFPFQPNAISWLIGGALTAAVLSFFCCLVQLGRAYHRQHYRYLPLLRELNEKLNEWQAFYQDAGYPDAELDFFTQELRTRIMDAADANTLNNDARSALLHWARIWLFWLLGFTTTAGVLHVVYHARFHA